MFNFGYLDPSTGSLFVQALIGSVAGVGFVFRKTLGKIVRRAAVRNNEVADAKAGRE
jgi:hypothetical protein